MRQVDAADRTADGAARIQCPPAGHVGNVDRRAALVEEEPQRELFRLHFAQLMFGSTEDAARGRVARNNPSVLILHDHTLVHGLHEQAEARFRGPQFSVDGNTGADIACYRDDAFFAAIDIDVGMHLDRKPGAIAAPIDGFHCVRTAKAESRQQTLHVIGGQRRVEIGDCQRLQRLTRVPEDAARRLVGIDDMPDFVVNRHGIRHRIDQASIAACDGDHQSTQVLVRCERFAEQCAQAWIGVGARSECRQCRPDVHRARLNRIPPCVGRISASRSDVAVAHRVDPARVLE